MGASVFDALNREEKSAGYRMAAGIVKTLLLEEIERIIADARKANDVVRAGYHAGQLLRAYPQAGLTLSRIIDEITAAAAMAKVPVEISPAEELVFRD
jgi:hypothetical protein